LLCLRFGTAIEAIISNIESLVYKPEILDIKANNVNHGSPVWLKKDRIRQ
jgi:hypothetical protein